MSDKPSTSSETVLSQLEANLTSTTIRYVRVKFPMELVVGSIFQFNSVREHSFAFSRLGAGYLSERIPGLSYAHAIELWAGDAGKQTELCYLANVVLVNGKEYVLALVDDEIVGVMTHYNPVAHADILTALKVNGLESHVTYARLSQTELVIDVNVHSKVKLEDTDVATALAADPKLIVSLRIINGHSGHSALSYNLYARVGAFEYVSKLEHDRRRHLSHVRETLDGLEDAVVAAADVKLQDRLQAMPAVDAIAFIRVDAEEKEFTLRQEKLMGLVEGDPEIVTALDVVTALGQYAGTRGYVAAVNGLLTPLFDHIIKGA